MGHWMSRLRKERLLSVRPNVMKKCLEPQVLIQSPLSLIPKWPNLTKGSLIVFIPMTQILPRLVWEQGT
ncbi:hypothetical protein AMTRI_Chr13g117450 [Amborella trichopoda]